MKSKKVREGDSDREQIARESGITERKRAESMLIEQKQLLELIAAGCSMETVFAALTESASRLQPDVRAGGAAGR